MSVAVLLQATFQGLMLCRDFMIVSLEPKPIEKPKYKYIHLFICVRSR
jgi:hypothetical protein